MATAANGVTVPAGSDAFNPQADMVTLNASAHGRLHILAANGTARAAQQTTCGWTPTTADPLVVLQTDTGLILRYDGTRWHYLADTEVGNQTITSNPTLGTSMSTLCTVTATTLGGPLRIVGSAMFANGNSGADRTAAMQITLDGVAQTPVLSTIDCRYVSGSGPVAPAAFTWELAAPSAGSHTILLQAMASTLSAVTVPAASLVVIEKP